MIAGLLALPGIDQAGAERLAAAGRTLEEILAKALPRRARRSGLHHDIAIDLSLRALQEVQVELPALTDCGRCGGPVRESDGVCSSCGTRIFFGESVASLDAALRTIEGEALSLDQVGDYGALPAGYRAQLEEALGPVDAEPLEPQAPASGVPSPNLGRSVLRPDVEAETQRLLSRGTRRRP